MEGQAPGWTPLSLELSELQPGASQVQASQCSCNWSDQLGHSASLRMLAWLRQGTPWDQQAPAQPLDLTTPTLQ